MRKIVKYCFVFAMVALAVTLLNSNAQADTIMQLINIGTNQASDENREYLIDNVFSAVGQLDVGDALRGSINFNTLNSAGANVGGLTGNSELSGVFQLLISTITPIPVGGGNFLFSITFAPDPTFEAQWGAGAIAVLFEDTSPDFAGDFDDPAPSTPPAGPDDGTPGQTVPPSNADVSVGPYATEEAFIATATDGSMFVTLGFLGLPGEGANALTQIPFGVPSILQSFLVTSGTATVNANLSLNTLVYGPAAAGLNVARVTPGIFGGFTDFALSQQLKGVSDLDTPFEIASNTNVSFTTVPEPSTLLLLGSDLLGVGVLCRRRKINK